MLSLLSAKDNLRVGFRIAPVDFLAGCCLRLDYTFGGLLLRGFCMNNGGDRCGCVNFIIPFIWKICRWHPMTYVWRLLFHLQSNLQCEEFR